MKKYGLHRLLTSLCLFALLLPAPASAQQPKKFDLTVDSIMRGPDLVGYEPTRVYWSPDSQRVYFRWKRAGEPRLKEPDLYVVNRDGGGLRKLSEDEAKLAPPANGEVSKDKRLTVFTEDGDLWLYDNAKNERRRLTETQEGESNAHFTRDQRSVYFTRNNNLYVLALDGGSLRQLTDIRTGGGAAPAGPALAFGGGRRGAESADGTEPEAIATGLVLDDVQQQGQARQPEAPKKQTQQDYLKKEERELLEAVRERALNREEQEAKRKKQEKRKPFELPAGQSVTNLTLTPDGAAVIATVIQSATGTKSTIVPNYVTESAFTEDIPGRTKVGDAQTRNRIAIINVENGEVKYVDHGQKVKAPNGNDDPKSADRDVQLLNLQLSEDGKNAALLARSADNKDRWVLALDQATGKTQVLDYLHDEAWVGGPGAFSLGFLPDNKTIFFESEKDGWAHLYSVPVEGGAPQQLTSGKFEVSDVRLSDDKTKFYFTSSEGSLYERHFYSMPIAGGARTRLTSLPGNNAATLAPDESQIALVRSYSNKPPELYLAAANASATPKQITASPLEEFASYNWIDPPIVQFAARDGAQVPGRLYKPANWKAGGPAVLFVHGAGYLQNVHKWWSSYFREYMFHHLLMERGYLVFDIDYRASSGYGRDWRTGIYRHMGGQDLTDHLEAVKYLVAEHGVDSKRVGLYGGSYGGFITLMALFTEPDVFAAGAALRPVTDWAHYNHGYTANILNQPQDDAEAYKQSSPIYFAQNLKGALLICHGMVDTNVHFQDSVRLAQRLIELRKENWELAVFPVEDHGFERATSWADEYKRILKLFETNLNKPAAAATKSTAQPPANRRSGK
ncbi:MAG: prolyl oligopeptidase family serine peptidase [Acidobacteria bacterium]|nr:prolyl oligopeptidase family serine peptidase [Acidobacteriota bacterium]MBI3425315.1 prolyl oligopeptidase family serine peptidase [Acidobacteriota bacterium]